MKSNAKSQTPFDELCWTLLTITMLCSVLTSMDLYKYLVEIGFIDNTVSSCCLHCSGKLTLVTIIT
ncbi:Uncharacterized protein APZ42_024392 [Daphnia magna]|uniref:Uncharacterized protein n=1 Tax=Daphnia magna TaxID=35525 RepID=A0A164U2Q3_9CRUS|nr:Uncharacterized protein APZ42_024392 [Daphnia magna]